MHVQLYIHIKYRTFSLKFHLITQFWLIVNAFKTRLSWIGLSALPIDMLNYICLSLVVVREETYPVVPRGEQVRVYGFWLHYWTRNIYIPCLYIYKMWGKELDVVGKFLWHCHAPVVLWPAYKIITQKLNINYKFHGPWQACILN